MRRIAQEVPSPLVINMIEGGQTPLLPLEEVRALGFLSVGYVLTGLFAAAKALDQAYRRLLQEGSSLGFADALMPFAEFTSLLGLEEKYQLDEKYRV